MTNIRQISIRNMRVSDIKMVVKIEKDLFPKDNWSEAIFQSQLKLSNICYYIVALRSDVIVGYAGIILNPDSADVQTIAVKRTLQGNKIGDLLLQNLIYEAKAHEVVRLILEVREDNLVAQKLYKKYQFYEIFRRNSYYPDNMAALVMEKIL